MIRHYIKIAFRNLWKYKNQTLVSVVGLAIGFACFAIATLWIRYEMSYDSFHKNADRIYCVSQPNVFSPTGVSRNSQYRLAGYLKNTFPEIAHAIPVISYRPDMPVEIGGFKAPADILEIDSSFFGMFDVKVVEGNMDFLIPESKNIAVTRAKTRQLFGNESPFGKKIRILNDIEYTVCAVVTDLPKRSNYPFDILIPMKAETRWIYSHGEHTLIELLPGVDVDAFRKKLYEHTVQESKSITKMTLTPLTQIRYKDPNILRDVKFQHIVIFAVAGSLLILCTLFNYLTLFVSRFRIRQRELALRVVFGASNRSLLTMLSIEFLMSLLIALVLGFACILAIIPLFRELSGIKLELLSICFESLIYIAGIVVISLPAFIVMLAIFRRRKLNMNMRQNNRRLFRKASIAVQLIISIVFAFCTVIILKQMHHLHGADLGFAIKNRGSVTMREKVDTEMLNDKIKQIPEITETITGFTPLIPIISRTVFRTSDWDDKPENATQVDFEYIAVSKEFIEYYEIKTVEGEFEYGNGTNMLFLNESAAKAFGWHSAAGKMFKMFGTPCRADGIIRNIYNMSPTITAKPIIYTVLNDKEKDPNNSSLSILFKFNDGTWKTCKRKIEEIVKTEYPNMYPDVSSAEEEYDKFLKSENTLLRILTLVSLVCVIVCVFGFVSMVSLTCEERRKEIAIRKIHGATIKDILDIFFKEYLTLLAVGALIAFPVGYIIMKGWLEYYVVQTEISAWIYASILLALIMAIILCVGGKVYKTSRANPIDAVKS
jgi:ABC-type antimicrobial peptide transport system permease subunit